MKALREISLQFWILACFLIVVFLTGGGSRPDIHSLIVLRPVSILLCGYAVWTVRKDQLAGYSGIIWFAAAVAALVISHLIPLPPSLWGMLPGRGILQQIDRLSGIGPIWRPISMDPDATWAAFYALFPPLVVVLLGVQLKAEDRYRLLPLLIGLGLLSGMIGLLQVVGPNNGPLYFYAVTNADSAVGLFANRNHEAVLLACLFPMLATFASTQKAHRIPRLNRRWFAIGAGVIVIPLIMVTGSRAGLIAGILGLASVPLLYRSTPGSTRSRKPKRQLRFYAAGVAAVVGLGLLFVATSREQAISRLLASQGGDEDRLQVWGPMVHLGWKYFPFGSGIGSFVRVFQIDEPYSTLSANYYNHAHNDFIELFLTGGLAALLLLGWAMVAYGRRVMRVWRPRALVDPSAAFGRMASIVIALLSLASIGDYPLRTPLLMSVAAVAALWLFDDGSGRRFERAAPTASRISRTD